MAIMQVIAARAAGVTRLVFHTVDSAGATDFAAACALPGLDIFRHSETLDPEALLQFCAARSFRWDTRSDLDSVITFGHATGATIRMYAKRLQPTAMCPSKIHRIPLVGRITAH
jgi:hypothetical protein